MRLRSLLPLILAPFVLATAASAGDWPFYRHDLSGSANAGESLSAAQAGALQVNRWYHNPAGAGDYDSNPIVANGMLYWVGGDHVLHAVDLTQPKLTDKWTKYIASLGPFPACVPNGTADPVGAPAVVGSTVYVPGGDDVVYALNALDGTPIWSTKIGDLSKGDFLWSSIFPLNGSLYVGVSSLHDCMLVPGRLVKLDQATGAVVATWWGDASHGPGASIWTQPAYDARTNRLFVTTGTLGPGQTRQSQPWADAFVAINPDTMQTVDSFAPVPVDSYSIDADFGASPTLYDGPPDSTGAVTHYILATDKDGYVYALNRDNLAAGLLWQYQISAGGASPDFGESTIVSAPYANGMVFAAGGATPDGKPGAIAGLDAFSGAEKWRIYPGGFVLAGMLATDGVLFALVDTGMKGNGIVLALDQTTGKELYRFTAGRMFGMPTWANGALYVGDATGAMFELTPAASPQPDYDLVLGPLTKKGLAGGPVTFNVIVHPKNGFSGDVTLASTKLPAARGISASFSPPALTQANGYSGTLTVSADASINSLYDLVVIGGTSAGLPSRTAAGWMIVQDYQLSAPASLTVVQGLSATGSIAIARTNGYAGAVSWVSVAGLPQGASFTFAAGDQNGTTLTVSTTALTRPGIYPLVVNSTSGGATRTANLSLVVTQAADFQVAVQPAIQDVHAGTTAVYTVSVAPAGGFASGVSFAAQSLPAGGTATFTPGHDGFSATLAISFPRDTATGPLAFSVQVAGGGLVHSASAAASVLAAADFDLIAAQTVSLVQGGTATLPVTVAPRNGLASVALDVHGLPAGVDASWDTQQASAAATLTLRASAAAAPGSYALSITGSGGGATHVTAANLTIAAPPKTGCTSAGAPGFGAALIAYAFLTARNRRRRSTTAR